MTLVVTDAIVLHAFDYLESSRIVRLATRELGVQSVLARGARRPKSRFGASMDLFAKGVAMFNVRPGHDLSNLQSFDLTRSRFAIAQDLDRFSAAMVLAELALRFSHADPHDGAFAVLDAGLDALTEAPRGTATDLGLAAAWRFVAALGFAPSIDLCCVCHGEVPPEESASFSHVGGGIVCTKCTGRVPVNRALPASARAAVREWVLGGEVRLEGEGERRAHVRLLREFLHHHVADGRDLPALASWELGQRRSA